MQEPTEVIAARRDPSATLGRYVRVERLGGGGMGDVWRAWDPELGRWVALKLLRGDTPEELARFRREARMAAQLSHPNIAAIYEVGEEGGRPFIAMQYISGRTLADAPPADARRVAGWIRDAARALHAAHGRGMIHRDVKPSNIMIEGDRIFVLDFGLARPMRVAAPLTRSNVLMGTPAYMSPEQVRGGTALDARSDVYSLGVTLYELLAGDRPLDHVDPYELLRRVIDEPAPALRSIAPHIDADLETVAMRCLQKEPAARYRTALELAEDLDRWLRGEPVVARPVSAASRFWRKVRRHPRATLAAVLVVTALGGGGLFVAAREAESRRRLAQAHEDARKREEALERFRLTREAALQRLATLQFSVAERQRDLREIRMNPATARGDLERALEDVDRFVTEWPDEPLGRYVRARVLASLGRVDAAFREAEWTVGRYPDFKPAWTQLGMLRLEMAQYILAASGGAQREDAMGEAFAHAVRDLDRGLPPGREREEAARLGLAWTRGDVVLAKLAEIFRGGGDREETIRLLAAAFEEYRAEEYAFWLGRRCQRVDERLKWYDRALEVAPGYDLALLNRSELKMLAGDLAAAGRDLETAIAQSPECPPAYINRGAIRHSRSDFAGAIEDYTRAIEIRPSEFALGNRALARLAMNDAASAIADLDHALTLQPDWPAGLRLRGEAKWKAENLPGADADYTRYLELVPGDVNALSIRGQVRFKLMRFEEAAADWEQALKLAPPEWRKRATVEQCLEQARAAMRRP